LAIQPEYASAYYNKAVCYALQRQADLAVENLQTAIQLNPKYKEEAATDIDFDEIGREPQFQKIIQG